MRYRQGTSPEELGSPIGQEIALGSAVFGLFLGIGFVVVGFRSRVLWMTVWGAMLAVASIVYLGVSATGGFFGGT